MCLEQLCPLGSPQVAHFFLVILMTNNDPVPKTLCYNFILNTVGWTKSKA